jgi:1-deoxy-D-xylulose-5-phosphate reductoisomerase
MELTFEAPDRGLFACLDLAYAAGRTAGGAPAWLSAANEVAVDAFLSGRLPWLCIADIVADTMESFDDQPIDSLEAVLEADGLARARAEVAVEKRRGTA